MFSILSEQKKIISGIILGTLLILQGGYILFTSQKLFYSAEKSGIFYPLIYIELANNFSEILQFINANQSEEFLRLLDIAVFLLFTTSAFILLVQDFFKNKEFHRIQKFILYFFLLVFISLAIAEYFFWFHLFTSNKQELLFQFKTFSFIVFLKWITFFFIAAFLGILIWLEGRLYFLKLVGFFYVSGFFVFLFHFKFTRLIDLGLILVLLGFLGNWFYFIMKMLQYKEIKT